MEVTCPHWEGRVFFTWPADSSANNHLQKNPHRHTLRNNVLPATWVSLSPIKLTHKVNYHPTLLKNWRCYISTFKKWIQNWFYLFIWKISNQVRKFCFHNLWVYFESCKEVIHLNHLWQEHCKSTKHCQISSFKMFFPQHEFLWKSSYFHSLLKCHHYLEERNYLYIQKYLHGTLILIATCHHIRVSKSEVCLFFSKRSYVWQLFLAEDTL